jgi:hypothetical protein
MSSVWFGFFFLLWLLAGMGGTRMKNVVFGIQLKEMHPPV